MPTAGGEDPTGTDCRRGRVSQESTDVGFKRERRSLDSDQGSHELTFDVPSRQVQTCPNEIGKHTPMFDVSSQLAIPSENHEPTVDVPSRQANVGRDSLETDKSIATGTDDPLLSISAAALDHHQHIYNDKAIIAFRSC